MAYIGFETAALAEDATALPSAPSMALTGFASAPGWSAPENLQPINGVGSARPFGYKPGRREPSMNGRVQLSGATACKNIIRAASRYDTTLTSARANCVPLVAIRSGYAGRCGGTVAVVTGRFGMMEQVQIAWAENQGPNLSYAAQMLTLETASVFTAPTESAILAAGGNPYSWHESAWSLTTAGEETGGLDNILNSATLTISNAIERDGTRALVADDDTNPLSRAAYGLTGMAESITLELNTKNQVPAFDGLVITCTNAAATLTLTLTGVSRATGSQDETEAGGRFGFPSTYNVAALAVA